MIEHIEPYLENIYTAIKTHAPRVVVAFAILFFGWLVAKMVQRGLRLLFQKMGLDKSIPTKGKTTFSEIASKAVYLVMVLFVILLFFNYVDLQLVATPLAALFNKVGEALPSIAGALVFGLVGYLLARLARVVVIAGGERIGFDSMCARVGIKTETGKRTPIQWAGDLLFFVILLFFLPAVLGYLKIQSLVTPLQGLMERFLSFGMDLVGALLIVGVAWLIATVLRPLIGSLLTAINVDGLAQTVGFKADEKSKPSKWIPDVVFVIIILLSLPSALSRLSLPTLAEPIANIFNRFLGYLPNLLAAVILVALSWIVGRVIAGLLERLLAGIKFDKMFSSMGLSTVQDPNELIQKTVGKVAWIVIVLLGTLESLRLLRLSALANLLQKSILYVPTILGAILIVGAGLYLAKFVSDLIKRSTEGLGKGQATFLSRASYVTIVIFALSVALEQLSLGTQTVTAVVRYATLGVAAAFALAVGLGGKGIVEDYLREWKKKRR